MKNQVIAIVVTFNRKALLYENLNALLAQTEPCDILIIDNHSTDGTKKLLESEFPEIFNTYPQEYQRIFYLDTGINLGGAGGFSFGIKKAVEYSYKYLWIMDDDCIPEKTALAELLKADYELKGIYGFLASKVLWTDGNICKTNIQRYPMAKRVHDFHSGLVKVNYSSFVSMFFKSELVKELGLPIKEFFIWSDDLEYTRRISRKYPSFLCNHSIVTHKCKGNYGINIAIESPERIDRYEYIYRNDVYVFKREGLKGYLYIAARNIYHIFRILFVSKGQKSKKIKTIIYGTKKGIKFSPKIEYVS